MLERARAAGAQMDDRLREARTPMPRSVQCRISTPPPVGRCAGKHFMSYRIARSKLAAVMAKVAAGKQVDDLIAAVFD